MLCLTTLQNNNIICKIIIYVSKEKYTMPGVLFEGGSFRAVFSCGVMDALLDNNIMFPYCIGVSAGAANSASYISKQSGRNIQVYVNYRNDKRYVGKRNFLTEKSLFGIDFVFRKVPNELIKFDLDTFRQYTGKFVVVVTDALTGKAKYFGKDDIDEQFNVFCATCALPGAFPAVEISGGYYYDGGLSNPVPIDKCIEDGNKKMLIVLTQPDGYKKTCLPREKRIARLIQRKYPAVADRILHRYKKYNKSLEICNQLESEGKAIILRPPCKLESLESDINILKQTYKQGYNLAEKKLDEIKSLF